MRYLVVNADDFGFTRDVNAGIVRAHREGILTATTLMANGDAFADAVRLSAENPSLDIGVHLQMVQGQSLSEPGRLLPATVGALIGELFAGRWDVLKELEAQVEKILAAGIKPSHLDTHKHTHLLPPILDAVARVSEKYAIRWVRKPFDLPLDGRRASWKTRAASFAMSRLRGHFDRVLARHGALATNHFAGFLWTGDFSAQDLVQLLEALPQGSTEFMCHPGILGEELRAAPTRLKESRELELRALTDPSVRQAITASGIRLVGYNDLPR
ncbi:MAG: ChbG/HpnK family deacetylase [Acidobacteria bacterium]|nr:ChbG/HpnK family deacetylase [Acidobacteriota bacterium]